MHDARKDPDRYECVEPELGDELWRLDGEDLPARERLVLEDHLALCDACRLRRAADRHLASGLADGSLNLHEGGATAAAGRIPRLLPRLPRRLGGGGGLALAAGLALAILLPPAPRDGGLARAVDGPAFVRPVEGEVLLDLRPRLSWRPVPGATRYRLRITAVDGDFAWQGETTDTALELPAGMELPRGRDLRALLEPVPADLAAAGGLSVSFRTDGLGRFLAYRTAVAPLAARLLGAGGLLALLGAGAVLPLRRAGR